MQHDPQAQTLSPALPDDLIAQAAAVLARANDAGLSLATAESCTGGLLATLLTDIEGASRAFDRGFVVYSEASKCDLLGLEHALIDRCGAVSAPVACGMAQGALHHSRADAAVAITGFAGPAGPDDEPGLVHFACAAHGTRTRHHEAHFGDIGRGATRIACLRTALELLDATLDRLVA